MTVAPIDTHQLSCLYSLLEKTKCDVKRNIILDNEGTLSIVILILKFKKVQYSNIKFMVSNPDVWEEMNSLTHMDVVCIDALITGATKYQIIDHLRAEDRNN